MCAEMSIEQTAFPHFSSEVESFIHYGHTFIVRGRLIRHFSQTVWFLLLNYLSSEGGKK